jgi:hypothetical protein
MLMVDKEQDEANEIILLTRKERDWLLGKIKVSKATNGISDIRLERNLNLSK